MVEEPALKFRNLTEAVVLAALLDPDPENPISCEVRRLVADWSAVFRATAKEGAAAAANARYPIEGIAISIASETFLQKV